MTASQPPANRQQDPPRIDGTPEVGKILRASTGGWRRSQGAMFTYQWQLCDPAGATCSDVVGAIDRIYTVRAADIGRTIVVVVTATNPDGSAKASVEGDHRSQGTGARGTVAEAAPDDRG